ncbi:hypothetical protein WN990_33825 [Kitasatospora purpeofusca]|uniref:hypothetical protein n=1 Tax=Kitasatospora purpeofusca TaxID=67352 RepID=UPI0030F310F0
MGYLRRTSFLIFHDPDAPGEEKTLDPKEIAEIRAAHEAGKKDRVDALVRGRMGLYIPEVFTEAQRVEPLLELAKKEGAAVPDPATGEALVTAVLENRKRQQEQGWPVFGSAGRPDPAVLLEMRPPVVTEAEVKAAKEAAAAQVAGPDGARWREIVQAVQDESIVDENAFKEYTRTTFRRTEQQYLREFAWAVYGIVTSRAELPNLAYRPTRTSTTTVRFKAGSANRLGIDGHGDGSLQWNADKTQTVDSGETTPTLWAKIADGAWSKDGNWGGHLQVSCATAKGQWIDASKDKVSRDKANDGWVRPQSEKGDPVTFYDMGPYYEIWQKDRATGRPLVVQDGYLRFVAGATPGKFNLEDSTWD